ncbi:uncharacterized protein LOC118480265 [Helianthus annuus]|uniref:uncharacterized protein LOC118480265 n=1 Tax=Helianthus annuus TaxID=4232 RepID=UPI001652E55A|nr:uncharacterized protein LOC118480265 [Helianthus annuus]
MCGSDKLYSDNEFPIENVNVNKLKQVFKLVEIEVSEIEGFEKFQKQTWKPKSETKTSNVQKPKVSDSEKQSSSTTPLKMNVPLDFYEKLEKQTSTSPKKKYVPKKDQPSGQPPKNEFFLDKEVEELPRSISRWIMDSGASRHMTGRKTLLYDVRGFNGGYISFASNQGGRIIGEGTLSNGVITFERVNYIEELENNLLSISQICDRMYSTHFTDKECLILKPGFVIPEEWIIMRAPRVNDLYVSDMSVATTTTGQTHCFMSRSTQKESELWHRKMGHIHLRKMNYLEDREFVMSTIRRLSDNGTEFSAPYTPQQNGVAERKNRTLIETARTMLADSKLSINFWAEAVSATCYTLHRVLTVKKHNKTCFKLINNRKPNLEYLEPCGSPCTVLDPDGKFGSKSIEGIFVGYASPLRRVFVPSLKWIIEAQHVECEGYTMPPQKPADSWRFNYDTLRDSFELEEEPEFFDDLHILQEYEASQGRFPERSSRRQQQTSNDDEAESKGEQIQSSDQTILDNEQVVDQNVTNLEGEVDVPGEVMPRTLSYHPEELIIGELLSGIESRTYKEALTEDSWVNAMQEELSQFEKLGVWKLVDLPDDVKSAFIYDKVKEEVYVGQPLGFTDPIHKDKVYLLDKALYCLHQAPRAWYETISQHLLANSFIRGKVDATLFTKEVDGHLLIVQFYVDDIIFGSTNEELYKDFEKVMKQKFEMSSMGEMKFFLGLQLLSDAEELLGVDENTAVDDVEKQSSLVCRIFSCFGI